MNGSKQSVATTRIHARRADVRGPGTAARRAIAAALIATLLAGCGQRGPLTLPAAPSASSPTSAP